MLQLTNSNLDSDSVVNSDLCCHSIPSSSLSHSSGWLQRQEQEEQRGSDQQVASFHVALPKLLSQGDCPRFCKRLHWEHHVCKLNCEGPMKFHELRHVRCPLLVELRSLTPLARKNTKTANAQSGLITTEIVLHCCVCWSPGGNCSHICLLVGIKRNILLCVCPWVCWRHQLNGLCPAMVMPALPLCCFNDDFKMVTLCFSP